MRHCFFSLQTSLKIFIKTNHFLVGFEIVTKLKKKPRRPLFDEIYIAAALRAPPVRFENVSVLFGKPRIFVNDVVYEFHHKRGGIVLWRCIKHDEKCEAKVFTKQLNCWILNSRHNHPLHNST